MKKSACLFVPMMLAASFGATTLAQGASWLKTGASTSRPYGHIAYCQGRPADCAKRAKISQPASISLGSLQSINLSVNKTIKAVTDQDQYGIREKWSLGVRAGDCEDFALAKRAALQRRGVAKSNLLLAVGRAGGEAHTVLVVRTKTGDYVLDNLTDTVLPISSSRVGIRKIQSQTDGADWLSVTGKTESPNLALSE